MHFLKRFQLHVFSCTQNKFFCRFIHTPSNHQHMLRRRIPETVFGLGAASLAITWWTKPKPYPPYNWSEEAVKFPDHIRLGLGPYHYFCEEKGAITPVDRPSHGIEDLDIIHMLKPGWDSQQLNQFVLTCLESVKKVEEKFTKISKLYMRKDNYDLERLRKLVPEIRSGDSSNRNVFISVRMNMKNSPFNSVVSFEERRKNEAIICDVLAKTVGGSYHPLCGNMSRVSLGIVPMSERMLDVLRSQQLMFEAPWTTFDLSAGLGRHWPDARGVWVISSSQEEPIVAWINHEDHLELVGVSNDPISLVKKLDKMREDIGGQLESVAKSSEFGYVSVKPEMSGNGLIVSDMITLERLGMHKKFRILAKIFGIHVSELGGKNEYHFVSTERFNISPSEAVERAVTAFTLFSYLDKQNDADEIIEKIIKKF